MMGGKSMEEMVREYGFVLLACFVGMILLGLLFNNVYSFIGGFVEHVVKYYF